MKEPTRREAEADSFSPARALDSKSARGQHKQPGNSYQVVPVQPTINCSRKEVYAD